MFLKHDLKEAHLNNLCKQTGCKYVKQEGQMSLYFKQEGQDAHLATIVYNKRLSKAERRSLFSFQLSFDESGQGHKPNY